MNDGIIIEVMIKLSLSIEPIQQITISIILKKKVILEVKLIILLLQVPHRMKSIKALLRLRL